MRKKICFCLALVILLSSLSMLVGAVDFSSLIENTSELGVVEPKSFSTATLEENFADDSVLVVLNNKASLNFKEYSPADFKEIKCAAISDLSTSKKKQVKAKVSNFQNSVRTMSAESKAVAVEEINKYNQIICLELADKGKENVLAAIKALESRDDVMYVGPDYIMSLCATTPTDTHQNEQWAITEIHLNGAWDLTTNVSGVVVGVLDSGIDASHPDLQGHIVSNMCADFTQAYVNYAVPSDYSGHGTHVAGIIAATMNNREGIAGVASGVKLAVFRVFDANHQARASKVALAINYAEDIGLQILNFSGAWFHKNERYDCALDAIISNYSGLFICSAGNENRIIDYEAVYPASLTNSNVLAVGASTDEHQRRYNSNYGANSVDVFAPGDNILSCFPTAKCLNDDCESNPLFADTHSYNGYHSVPGTSMAAPYVTGIAALMLSENPGLTPLQMKTRIIETCTDYTALRDKCVSDGIVNACHAVLSAYPSTAMNLDSNRTISIGTGQEHWVKITVPYDGYYSFFTTGNLHTVGELYHYQNGLLQCSSNANSSTPSNFYIEQFLDQGAIVYLKITVKGTPSSGSFVLWAS